MDRAKGVIRRAVDADWPHNWTDPLLTGPDTALLGEVNCPQIERLLEALKRRVLNVIDSTRMR